MSGLDPSSDRREQILGEVAEGLHAIFKEAQRRALEAEDNDEFVRLSGSLCKVARGVRQCLGMHAKLERDRLCDAAEAAEDGRLAREAKVQDRKARIARAVGRRLEADWPETGDLDDNEAFNDHVASFNERLDGLCADEDFLDLDPDALIAQLCEEFGLTPPDPQDPLIAAKARTQTGSTQRPTPASRANGHDSEAPPSDTS